MHTRPYSAPRPVACEEFKVYAVLWGQHWRFKERKCSWDCHAAVVYICALSVYLSIRW